MNTPTKLIFSCLLASATMSAAAFTVNLKEVEPISLGESVKIEIASISEEGIYKYEWRDRSGEIVGTGANLSATPSRPEVYELTVSDDKGNQAHAYAEVIVYGITDAADFEDNTLAVDEYWRGRIYDNPEQTTSNFFSGGFMFGNSYTPAWDYWCGFVLSKSSKKDFTSPYGPDQYNCVTGRAHQGDGFALANINTFTGEFFIDVLASKDGAELAGVYLTTNSYLYTSATKGDTFAKPLTTGDYHKVIFTGDNGNTVEFFLADFTGDNAYVLDDWAYCDLSALGKVKRIKVDIQCTNENIPTYVCLDDISYKASGSNVDAELSNKLRIAFEQGGESLSVAGLSSEAQLKLYSISGSLVANTITANESTRLNTSTLPRGIYILSITQNNSTHSFKVVK